MIKYYKKLTWIRSSILNIMMLDNRKMQLCFGLKNSRKRVVLSFKDIFLFLHNLSNLVNIDLFSQYKIIYNNKTKNVYNKPIQKTLVYTKNWKLKFFFHFFNILAFILNMT